MNFWEQQWPYISQVEEVFAMLATQNKGGKPKADAIAP